MNIFKRIIRGINGILKPEPDEDLHEFVAQCRNIQPELDAEINRLEREKNENT